MHLISKAMISCVVSKVLRKKRKCCASVFMAQGEVCLNSIWPRDASFGWNVTSLSNEILSTKHRALAVIWNHMMSGNYKQFALLMSLPSFSALHSLNAPSIPRTSSCSHVTASLPELCLSILNICKYVFVSVAWMLLAEKEKWWNWNYKVLMRAKGEGGLILPVCKHLLT